MTEIEALQNRIEELEHWFRREGRKETTTRVTHVKGRPMLRFEGSFHPFSLSVNKALGVLDRVEDIRRFVENHRGFLNAAAREDPS